MNANEWASIAVALVSLLVAFTGVIRHLVKHYLSELKPNSGASVKDQVTSLKDQVSRLEIRTDEIYSLILSNSTRR